MKRFCRNFAAVAALVCFSAVLALGQSTGGLRGKVRSVKGPGIPDATVTIKKKNVEVKSVKSDSKGEFTMEGLEAGMYNLTFEARGYNSGTLYNVEVKKNKIRDLEDRLILSTDQGTQVIIKGSVFDREGRSLTAAKIELVKIESGGSTRKISTGLSTVSGEFTFRQPEGTAKFRVTATYKGVSGSKEIEVDTAAIYRLAISLDISRDGN
jgi:hypothetical protein